MALWALVGTNCDSIVEDSRIGTLLRTSAQICFLGIRLSQPPRCDFCSPKLENHVEIGWQTNTKERFYPVQVNIHGANRSRAIWERIRYSRTERKKVNRFQSQ